MKAGNTVKRKWSAKRIMLIAVIVILSTTALLVYQNFNRLLALALIKSFESSIVSDVYELKFEKVTAEFLTGRLQITNVTLQPREKPLHDYPYIKASFRLKAEKFTLRGVQLLSLLESNKLEVEKISITKPDVEFFLEGDNYILFPFGDSTSVSVNPGENKKYPIDLSLVEFELTDASFRATNTFKEREFNIEKFNITLRDLLVSQQRDTYLTSFSQVSLAFSNLSGNLRKGPVRHIGLGDLTVGIDSLEVRLMLDTITYRFHDGTIGAHNLDIQTADSIYRLAMRSFDLSYKAQSIKLTGVSFKPNVRHAALQKEYHYQHTEFSGSVGKLYLNQVNFDSLLYAKKIFIDAVLLDNVNASVFKDKTKPLNKKRFPDYLGQMIAAIPLPVRIRYMKATHIRLASTERIPGKTLAKITLSKATLDVKNITNRDPRGSLTLQADMYIDNKAHVKAGLIFSYQKPQFRFQGEVQKFNLPDLNSLIRAYTPARINKGILDQITFSGRAEKTKATGTLKFLYHDLTIDLKLKDQAKWKNTAVTFAANTVLNSANPVAAGFPPRIVKFHIERDMNKGFVNVLIRSILNGLKETMIMSKENRKAFQNAKKKKQRTDKR